MQVFKPENVFKTNCKIGIRKQISAESCNIHTHEFIEIIYIFKGRGIHCIDNTEYPVKRGDLLFINYGQTHSFHSCSQMEHFDIFMKPDFISAELINNENAFEMLSLTIFEEFRASLNTGSPLVRFSGAEIRAVENIIEGMHAEYVNLKKGYAVMLKSYVTALITHIFRKMSLLNEVFGRDGLDEALVYIRKHCSQKLSLSMMAERCFYNPSYFSRIFKEFSGMTLTDFIHESRIKKACELLNNTSLPIERICFDVGYTDKTAFYKQFKTRIGMLPSAYRK